MYQVIYFLPSSHMKIHLCPKPALTQDPRIVPNAGGFRSKQPLVGGVPGCPVPGGPVPGGNGVGSVGVTTVPPHVG